MNLERLENELKKMWEFWYAWWRKQNNGEDTATNFIYSSRSFLAFQNNAKQLPQDLQNYAMNRWYNFWSAMWVENIFSKHPNVEPNTNSYDKLIDFSIDGITFDHKTSVFPKAFGKDYAYAKENKKELIEWLYNNQSQQGRKHLENRLFICIFDTKNGEHWKWKAEIGLLKNKIDDYVTNFDASKLIHLDFWNGEIVSDIVWFEI